MIRSFLIVWSWALFPIMVFGQRLFADGNSVALGTEFLVRLEVPMVIGRPTEIDLSVWDSILPPVNRLSQSLWRAEGDFWRQEIKMIGFAPETLLFPGLEIPIDQGPILKTNSLEVRINLMNGFEGELGDIMPLHYHPADRFCWGYFLIPLILIGIWWGWRCFRKPANIPLVPSVVSPSDTALEAISALRFSRAWEGDEEAYYGDLSFILRVFLQARFGVCALELSTREIVSALAQQPGISKSTISAIDEFLQRADVVKFSPTPPAALSPELEVDEVEKWVRILSIAEVDLGASNLQFPVV